MKIAKRETYNIKDLYPNSGLSNSIFGISSDSVNPTYYKFFLSYNMLDMAPITIIRTAINDVLIKNVRIALTTHNEIRNVFFNAFLLNLKQASPMIATAALLNPARMTFIELLSNSGI